MILIAGSAPAVFLFRSVQFRKFPAACRKAHPEDIIPILFVQDVVFYKLGDPLYQVTFPSHRQFHILYHPFQQV